MKRSLLIVALASGLCAGLRGQTVSDANFGLRLEYSPSNDFSDGQHSHRVSWWIRYGHIYNVEFTTDLALGAWQNFLPPITYEELGDRAISFDFTAEESDRLFFRIHATKIGPALASNWPNTADTDHDGVPDTFELAATPPTSPLSWPDTDGDGLPDDWERWRSGSDSLALENTPANYIDFKRDWAIGVTARYGTQHFVSTYLPTIHHQQRPHHEHVLQGDQGGSMRIIYTDDSLSTISSIYVIPRYNQSVFAYSETETYQEKPAAIYEANPDTQVGGFIFRAHAGQNLTGYDPDTGQPIYEFQIPRDLLRGLDMMTDEAITASQTPESAPTYKAGKTRSMAFRRSEINMDGQTHVLRTASALAITSQPLTQISPRRFPVVLRDKVFTRYAGSAPTDIDFAGYGGVLPQSITLLSGWLEPSLDPDGLPQATLTRVKKEYERMPYHSRGSFSTWFRGDNAQTYLVNGVPTPTEAEPGILAPGSDIRYPYGIFNDDFYPHAKDVPNVFNGTGANDHDHFTTEIRMKLDYTPDTALYLAADDDCWVFINGKLVQSLDRAGVNSPINQPTNIISGYHSHPAGSSCETPPEKPSDPDPCVEYFQSILQRVGLPPSNGTCDVAIFHASRIGFLGYTQLPALRFLSNSPLRPIYHYQVVAEGDGYSSIHYKLLQGPPGMTLHPTNGRLEWDVFGSVDIDGFPTYLDTAHTITILAEDYLGNSDEQTFTLNVTND